MFPGKPHPSLKLQRFELVITLPFYLAYAASSLAFSSLSRPA
jgi:hypothetical protein